MSEDKAGVMYVGRKPFAVDNICSTGKVWSGRGDVQIVSVEAALLLCQHPDQWWPQQAETPSIDEVDFVATAFFGGDRSVLKPIVPIDTDVEADKPGKVVKEPKAPKVPKDPKETKQKAGSPKRTDIKGMNATQLREFAKTEHGAKLKVGLTTEKLRAEVERLEMQALENDVNAGKGRK